ncbi:MAG TPA: hypothetical protein VJS45_17730 [Acidimicrobiia bacterium]|nr:hypothetical protein [Acidimicrobiia bacterium]
MPGTKDEQLADIAEAQVGAVANRQLRGVGFTQKDIKVRLRRGTLEATAARGVYRVAGSERSWRQDLWVALLAGPEGTVASHVSAAALRGLMAVPSIPQVTVPRGTSGRFGGAVVHYASVDEVDRARAEGVEATAIPRTLVDCAAVLNQKALDDLVDAAFGRHLCTYQEVVAAWERAGRVRGGIRLEAALAPYTAGAEPGSVAAAHVLRRICEWGFPMPLCEYEVRNERGEWLATVDFIWPAWAFVLEYDGGEAHGPRRRRLDARRQAAVEATGLRVERTDRFDARSSSTRLFDLLSAVFGPPPVGGNTVRLPGSARRPSRPASPEQRSA